MVKSRSEICKDYRKRLKLQDNEGYLHKERERRRKNYVATSLLSSSDKAARRQQTREAVRRCRERQKRAQEHHAETDQDTSGYESVQSSRKECMIVSMGFPNRKAGPKKRLTKQLNQAKKTIAELKKENESLARRLKTEQRRRQRIVKSVQSSPKTPRSKTERLMNNAGLTRVQKDKVRKSIMFGDVLAKQLLRSKQVRSRSSVSKLSKTVAGQIIRKYKMNGMLGRKLCLGKNTMSKYTSITPETSRPENVQITRKFEREIKEFLERDDNSRVQPGKADTVKCNGGLKQVRVLTDYMGNLHQKFISENVQCNVSFATFCRVRPKNIKLATFISRSSCLCTQHQNMALTAKTLRREGVQVSVNPEVFVKSNIDNETLEATLADNTKVPQWKRVDIEERGKRKQVMRIVDIEMTKQEFIEHIDKQRQGFSAHIDRVKSQYAGIRNLKQNLPDNHVVIQMDFAENFSCRSSDEIQSAYFNQTGVTLHPVVVYFKEGNVLKHNSFVIISDTLGHNANTVVTFLDTIMSDVKQLVPNVKVCHYWTDSPTSQYRNKLIFDTVANHQALFGCLAVWNFFEAGHGKGPCDGLGGMVKRMADTAIKIGKAVIQDAADFYTWASGTPSFVNVLFRYVPDVTIANKVSEMSNYINDLRPIKGTMKLHAVVGVGESKVLVRETSCYCTSCLANERCDAWRKESTRKKPSSTVTEINTRNVEPSEDKGQDFQVQVGDYVAAVYDENWYVGRVEDIDQTDEEVEITFMERKKELFQWPRQTDILWLSKNDLLGIISPPLETGKSKRMFKLSQTDLSKCREKFETRK